MQVKLAARAVEKPWGRDWLPAPFAGANGRRIGEIWFVPLKGSGSFDGQAFQAGECWLADRAAAVRRVAEGAALVASTNAPRHGGAAHAAAGETAA